MARFSKLQFVLACILGFAALLSLSCSDQATIDPQLSAQVILEAHVLAYKQLDKQERDIIGSLCCSYSTGGWMARDLVRFSPEDGYFVRARINVDALARLTEANQCGTSTHATRCSEKELQMKAVSLAGHSNPHMLYGKYKNSWVFIAGGTTVPATEKFDGHRLLSIKRDAASRSDDVLIGPIPRKPDDMVIELYSPSGRGHEPLRNPRRVLN
jgi:hypothetical protein